MRCSGFTTSSTDIPDPNHADGSYANLVSNNSGGISPNWNRTKFVYDRDGVRTELTDAEGNTTNWEYDSLGRLTRLLYPELDDDGDAELERQSIEYVGYNAAGLPTEVAYSTFDPTNDPPEARDSLIHEFKYDDYGRVTGRWGRTENLSPAAPDFNGTEYMAFEYDDLGRMTKAVDCESTPQSGPCPTADALETSLSHNSTGQLLRQTQSIWTQGQQFTHEYDIDYGGDGSRDLLTFPEVETGVPRYSVAYGWDARGKLQTLGAWSDPDDPQSAPATLATYRYLGGRVWDRTYDQNGSRLRFYDDDGQGAIVNGYDAAGRPRRVVTSESSQPQNVLAGYSYGYDRLGRPMYEQRLHEIDPGNPPQSGNETYRTRAYRHDRVTRLLEWAEGMLGSDPMTADTFDPTGVVGTADAEEAWELDLVANWTKHKPIDESGFDEFPVNVLNQTTAVKPQGATPGLALEYDWLGQLRVDENRGKQYVWDYFGRMTEVRTNADPSSLIASYRYDAFNRRVRREVPSSDAVPDSTMHYVYDDWRVIEERGIIDDQGTPAEIVRARYGYGLALDEMLWIDKAIARDGTGDPDPINGNFDGSLERLYLHHDRLGNTVAVSEGGSPAVAERFTYSAYGEVTAWWDATWLGSGYSSVGQAQRSKFGIDHLYTGQRLDLESGLGYFKNRYMDTQLGSFLRRDWIGYGDGPNMYSYVGANVSVASDPLGLYGASTQWRSAHGQDLRTRPSLTRAYTAPEKNTGYGPELGSTYRTANLGCGALSVRWRSCGEYDQFLRQKAWEQGPDSRSSRAGMGVLADCPPDVDQCEIVKPKQEAIKLPRLGDAEQRLRDFERWLGRQIPKHPADATRLDSFKRLLDVLAVVERIIDENPLMGRFFVTWELRTGGEFDPKRGYTKRTPKYEQAQDYGNLQGGAIIEAMGASRYITLAGAGAQSLASGMKEALEGDWDTLAGAGGYPPGLMPSYPVPTLTSGVEPFGDYNARGTAEWVGVGWEFGAGEW